MGYEPFSAELDALGPDRDWPPFNSEPQPDTPLSRKGLKASPYVYRDPSKIPPRAWLYDRRLIRGFISTTVAPGGIGKSSLELVEAIALATGRTLLGVPVPVPCRVWYWCGEDPLEEIERRVAAILIRYGIDPAELDGRLFLDSGRTSEIVIAETTRAGTVLAQPVLAALRETIDENSIDVVILDPFISTHRVYEAAVSRRDAVAKALREDYPRLAGELAALARQLAQTEAEVRLANRERPEDRPLIVGPEEMVRGVPPNGMVGSSMFPRLLDRLYLPNLDRIQQAAGNAVWSPDKVATA
ncbi:hypothetical protein ASF24_13835 [Methylobacterium sp. Leaf86]|uniref:AAA family ATPase n=1 Tax=Methylobacterium sp. Leaf86 TaxID=1736242 RepID=UPI0006F33B94|nr:AAA family ATPase [Methylobacterium sp. Leaf86]KQO59236.1 hypothetical protein ASF24_13835 [Methylobacterium sp. Leaf86]